MRYGNFNDQYDAVDRMRERQVRYDACACWIYDRVSACMSRAKTPKAREILATMLQCVNRGCYCTDSEGNPL